MALFLGPGLDVAPRQVEADRVTENQTGRHIDRHIGTTGTERDDHLDLVVQIGGRRRITDGQFVAATNQRIGWLGEEKGRFQAVSLRRRAHFPGVPGVVATNAENPANRKKCIAVKNRYHHRRTGRNGVMHEMTLACCGKCAILRGLHLAMLSRFVQ